MILADKPGIAIRTSDCLIERASDRDGNRHDQGPEVLLLVEDGSHAAYLHRIVATHDAQDFLTAVDHHHRRIGSGYERLGLTLLELTGSHVHGGVAETTR